MKLDFQIEKSQDVFILERSEVNLTVSDPKEYILEGIAAVFGAENNNGRIYEETEYMPHLEYLQEKISARRLVGELDHPEKFDVSLKHISHMIESLVYDKGTRQLKIKVRLLDTPGGKIAKTLVDAGIPISISSRAAGSVMENKKVKIKKIFTYDLVADPGFEKAQLNRVYESANFVDNYSTSIITKLHEFEGMPDNVKMYSIDESEHAAFVEALEGKKENKPSTNMSNFVSVDEMNEYSAIIKKTTDELKAQIKELKESATTGPTEAKVIQRLGKLEKYTKYLAENLDKNIQYSDYLAESLDKDIEYTKYLAENLDKNITFADYLAENLEKNITYSEYLAENLDKNITYSEYLAENLDRNISYSEYLAENLDRNISYSEYLAENLDRGIGYSEYLAEKISRNIAYSEYIAESVNNDLGATVNESNTTVEQKTKPKMDYTNLSESINELLQSANNQKAAGKLNETKYKFFKFLNEEKRNEFMSLNETKKEKVAKALNDGAYFSQADVTRKWDAAIVEQVEQDNAPLFIQLMPESVKPLWESISVQEKERTFAASQLRKLETEYQIKNFWNSRGFVKGQTHGLVKLNENESITAIKTKPSTSGISSDYMAGVAEAVGKRFNK
jgi:hypothetical protein